ncbi:MAG: hypothetical protein OEN02_11095 [Gammaproteobacteria bacterium]|nr:hypothetical protein [Gammaproteobacteria bacterium]MDH3535699.1 hypothetical protein [Gammaproteobacteria bacterium]
MRLLRLIVLITGLSLIGLSFMQATQIIKLGHRPPVVRASFSFEVPYECKGSHDELGKIILSSLRLVDARATQNWISTSTIGDRYYLSLFDVGIAEDFFERLARDFSDEIECFECTRNDTPAVTKEVGFKFIEAERIQSSSIRPLDVGSLLANLGFGLFLVFRARKADTLIQS